MGVRKIKKSYISCTGYFSSQKNKKQITFESVLERDFFMLLEFDKDVTSYEDQPFRISYELDRQNRRYTPDVLVTYYDGLQKVYEVKYQDEINSNKDLQNKLSYLKEIMICTITLLVIVITAYVIYGIIFL